MSLTRGLILDVANQVGGAAPNATVLHDWSRYGNNGAFLGAGEPNWLLLSSGLWVLDFDGINDSIVVPDVISTHAFTYMCFFNANTWGGSNGGRFFQSSGANTYAGYLDNINSRLGFTSDWVSWSASAFGSIALTTTTHFASTRTEAGIVNFYINGVLNGPADQNSGTPTVAASTILGNDAGATVTFDGWHGLIKIFNYTLTPAQIRARYHSTRWLFGV